MISNLYSVANSYAAQMPIENLAKIFGPTILGYSCADPDHHAILSETMVQKDVSHGKTINSFQLTNFSSKTLFED